MIWVPGIDVVRNLHFELVQMFQAEDDPISPAGIKNEDLLASACQRPHTSLGGTEKYSTVFFKAAALFHSLTKNHAFHNGNKRTALVSLITMLHRNDYVLSSSVTDDVIYNVVLDVTKDEFGGAVNKTADTTVAEIAGWLRQNTEKLRHQSHAMRPGEFAEKCEMAGASVKKDKRRIVIRNKEKSITINQAKSALDKNVIRAHLKKLGLTQSGAGITAGEFNDGTVGSRDQIQRYIVSLRRLART